MENNYDAWEEVPFGGGNTETPAESYTQETLPMATKSVYDPARKVTNNVPINFDEDDYNFAAKTQIDGVGKEMFMGKQEVGDLSEGFQEDLEAVFFGNNEEKQSKEDGGWNVTDIITGKAVKRLQETSFGRGMGSMARSFGDSIIKGKVRQAETELERLKAQDDEVFANIPDDGKVFYKGEDGLMKLKPLVGEKKIERIAQLEQMVEYNKQVLTKTNEWFADYSLSEDADAFEKVMFGIGSGAGSVAYSFGVAAVTKNPTLAAGIIAGSFGKLQFEETYEKAVDKGFSREKASDYALGAAVISGGLELAGFKGLEKAVKGSGVFSKIASGIITESMQEGAQSLSVAAYEKVLGIDDKTWEDIAKDAAFEAMIGGIVGGGTGAMAISYEKKAVGDIEGDVAAAMRTFGNEEQRFEVLRQEIKDRLYQADPTIPDEDLNILSQSIVERAEGQVAAAIDGVNQVIAKEGYYEANDLTADMWLKQVRKNLNERGYTDEQINETFDKLNKQQNIKEGWGNVYDAALKSVEETTLSEPEKERFAELMASNSVAMTSIYKADGQEKELAIDYFNKMNLEIIKQQGIDPEELAAYEAMADNRFEQSAAEEKDLVAYHGITKESLSKALSFGGLPSPSLAIVRKGEEWSDFGEIVLVGGKDVVDPKNKTEVYNRDVWTNTFPFVEYEKVKANKLREFSKVNRVYFEEIGDDGLASVEYTAQRLEPSRVVNDYADTNGAKYRYIKDVLNKNVEPIVKDEGLARVNAELSFVEADEKFIEDILAIEEGSDVVVEVRSALKSLISRFEFDNEGGYAHKWKDAAEEAYSEEKFGFGKADSIIYKVKKYNREKGVVKIDFYDTRKLLDEVIEDKDAYNKWVKETIEEELVGDPKVRVGKKLMPFNLENVTAAMVKGATKNAQDSFIYSPHKVIAAGGKKLKSIKDIKKESKNLLTKEGSQEAFELLDKKIQDFAQSYEGRGESIGSRMTELENVLKAMGSFIEKGNITEDAFKSALNYEFYETQEYPVSFLKEGVALAKEIQELSRYYFEAKPQRAVGFSEFEGAIVPTSTDYDDISKTLEENGLKVIRSDKKAADDSFSNIFFQESGGVELDANGHPVEKTAVARGEIEKTASGYIIRLFEHSDPSTLFHEMFHMFTFQLQERAKVSKRAAEDWETLATWSGYNSAVSAEDKREALEKMARGGEQYLMKGKAPSKKLEFAFANFKKWLTDIYRNITNLNVNVTPEVERVFGRLIGGKSLDYAFVSEKTELGQELKKMRQKNIDAVVNGRYIITDQTQMQEITGIERVKSLTNAIIGLSKLNKGKDLLLAISDNYGDFTIEDIENLVKTTKMRLPRKGKTLYQYIYEKGGITKEFDTKFDITSLLGVERTDKIIRKATKKERFGDEVIWDTSKRPAPINTEEDLIAVVTDGVKLAGGYITEDIEAYEDLDAQWEQVLSYVENAHNYNLDNNARQVAEEAVNDANRILEDIFGKSVDDIEQDFEDYYAIKKDFDIISKDLLKDIRGLSILIEREVSKLQRLVKKNALEEARSVREDIIALLERNLPSKYRGSFLRQISQIDTYERLIARLPNLVDRIVKQQEEIFKKKIHGRVANILKWSKTYKDQTGKKVSRFRDPDVQDFMNEAISLFKVTNKDDAAKMIEELLPNDDTSMPSKENVFKIKLLEVASNLTQNNGGSENFLDVYSFLLDTYKAGKFAAEAERQLRKEKNLKIAKDSYEVIEKVKIPKKGWLKDKMAAIKRFYFTQQGWEDIMDIISSGDGESKSYSSSLSKSARVLEAEVRERGITNKWGKEIELLLSEALGTTDQRAIVNYVNNLGKKIDLGTFETTKTTKWGASVSEEVEMTRDQILDFYMKWLDESSRASLLDPEGNGYTEDQAQRILQNLTEQDKLVAEGIFRFYESTRGEVFEAYRKEYGVSLNEVKFYTPRYREVNGDIVSYYKGNVKSVSTGRVKVRSETAKGAINLLGAFSTMDRYVGEVSHYLAWHDKLRDLNTIFGDKDIRAAIRKRYGNSLVEIIDKQVQDFASNGKVKADAVSRIINGFRTNFTVSVLSLKPSIMIQQLSASMAFLEYVPAKNFVGDMVYAIKNFKKVQKILNKSDLMKTRFKNMNLEVSEAVNKKAVQRFMSDPKFTKALMMFVEMGDVGAIYTGGYSVYAQAIRDGKSEKEAIQEFEMAVNSSQQSSYLSELSEWQRGGAFHKLFTMFTSSQNQYFRKEMSAVRGLMTGRMDKNQAIKRIAIYHFMLPMLFQWICDLGRWDEKSQLRAAILGSFNGIFLLKDLLDPLVRKYITDEKVFGYKVVPLQAMGEDIIKGIGKLHKAWVEDLPFEDFAVAVKDMMVAAGTSTGLPLKQLDNVPKAVQYISEGNVVEGIEVLAGWSPYAVAESEGGLPRDLVNAIKGE